MIDTLPKEIADLEELLEAEIPCQGIRNPAVATACDRSAAVRLVPHAGCDSNRPRDFSYKCIPCCRKLLVHLGHILADTGRLQCNYCFRYFYSLDDYAVYEPF